MFQGVNRVMRAYIYWDFVANSAWGLISPVFAIFILEKISGGNVVEGAKVVGFSTLVYWETKSILQIPIGNYLDKKFHTTPALSVLFGILAIIFGLLRLVIKSNQIYKANSNNNDK